MTEDAKEESEILLSPRIIRELKKAYRDSKSPTWAEKPLDYDIAFREILWYVLNQAKEPPFNGVEYIGALQLISRFELTKSEREAVSSKLVEMTERWHLHTSAKRAILGLLFSVAGSALLKVHSGWALGLGSVYAASIYVYVLRCNALLRNLRKRALSLIGDLGEPQAIPYLATIAAGNATARNSLFQLLPALTYSHYRAFDKATIPNLCAILETETTKLSPKSMERVELLVEALEKIGDSRALFAVQALKKQLTAKQRAFEDLQLTAQNSDWGRNVLETRAAPQIRQVVNPYFDLQERVEGLLTTLEGRRIQEAMQDNLLRASAPPDSSELLRPVAGKQEQDPPEQLLRASNDSSERER